MLQVQLSLSSRTEHNCARSVRECLSLVADVRIARTAHECIRPHLLPLLTLTLFPLLTFPADGTRARFLSWADDGLSAFS